MVVARGANQSRRPYRFGHRFGNRVLTDFVRPSVRRHIEDLPVGLPGFFPGAFVKILPRPVGRLRRSRPSSRFTAQPRASGRRDRDSLFCPAGGLGLQASATGGDGLRILPHHSPCGFTAPSGRCRSSAIALCARPSASIALATRIVITYVEQGVRPDLSYIFFFAAVRLDLLSLSSPACLDRACGSRRMTRVSGASMRDANRTTSHLPAHESAYAGLLAPLSNASMAPRRRATAPRTCLLVRTISFTVFALLLPPEQVSVFARCLLGE